MFLLVVEYSVELCGCGGLCYISSNVILDSIKKIYSVKKASTE